MDGKTFIQDYPNTCVIISWTLRRRITEKFEVYIPNMMQWQIVKIRTSFRLTFILNIQGKIVKQMLRKLYVNISEQCWSGFLGTVPRKNVDNSVKAMTYEKTASNISVTDNFVQ